MLFFFFKEITDEAKDDNVLYEVEIVDVMAEDATKEIFGECVDVASAVQDIFVMSTSDEGTTEYIVTDATEEAAQQNEQYIAPIQDEHEDQLGMYLHIFGYYLGLRKYKTVHSLLLLIYNFLDQGGSTPIIRKAGCSSSCLKSLADTDEEVHHQTRSDSKIRKRSRSAEEEEGIPTVSTKGKYSKKRRLEKFSKRNAGLSYDTIDGIEKPARKMVILQDCRSKCKDRITPDMQNNIFREYWDLGNRDKRANFISGLVESDEPLVMRKRTNDPDKEKFRQYTNTFQFKYNGKSIHVCRGCFMKTLGETNMFVTLSIESGRRSKTGIAQNDNRGKEPTNKLSNSKIQAIHNHINSFPAYESHYTRKTSVKKYLPAFLNLAKMYSLYTEHVENPASKTVYEREFKKLNISFKSPKVDTCHKCDVLLMKMKVAKTEDELQAIKEQQKVHLDEADLAYNMKKADKTRCKEDKEKSTKCYTFDLQQCLPTPFLNSSVSFYKRQLWTYNLTFDDSTNGNVTCYMWHEAEGARGANQIATCIFKQLSMLPEGVKQVVLYSDSCGGQNRNSHVSAMFLTLLQQRPQLKQIDHKFMVSGHSHLECDVDHGLIEKQKKKLHMQISIPHDWYQLVRTVKKKTKILQWWN